MANETLSTFDSDFGKWAARAATAEETTLTYPIITLMGEGLDLAVQVTTYWEPVTGREARPGLKEAAAAGLIPVTLARDLRELTGAVSHAHGQYRAVTATSLEAPVERGEFLLSEMRQCLEFIFDDGVSDDDDASLARLTESHYDTSSHDALAMSLEGFALFANRYRARLAKLPEFDLAMLDEAIAVATRLREQSALKLSGALADRQRTTLATRNRLVTLLQDHMARTRRAFHFVFRNHPRVAQLASSLYERDRKAARRAAERTAAERAAEIAAAVPVPGTPAAAPGLAGLAAPAAATEGARGNPFVP